MLFEVFPIEAEVCMPHGAPVFVAVMRLHVHDDGASIAAQNPCNLAERAVDLRDVMKHQRAQRGIELREEETKDTGGFRLPFWRK